MRLLNRKSWAVNNSHRFSWLFMSFRLGWWCGFDFQPLLIGWKSVCVEEWICVCIGRWTRKRDGVKMCVFVWEYFAPRYSGQSWLWAYLRLRGHFSMNGQQLEHRCHQEMSRFQQYMDDWTGIFRHTLTPCNHTITTHIGVNVFIRMNLRLNLNSFQHNNLQFALDHKRLMISIYERNIQTHRCIISKGTT